MEGGGTPAGWVLSSQVSVRALPEAELCQWRGEVNSRSHL